MSESKKYQESRSDVYPYLLRDVAIERRDQVWSSDITYLPLPRGFMWTSPRMAGAGLTVYEAFSYSIGDR